MNSATEFSRSISLGDGGSVSEPTHDVADIPALVVLNQPVNADYFHMVLDAGQVAASAKAGQFFNLGCPATTRDMPYLRRPMSVYRADPASARIEFLYKVTGAGTRGLATLRAGDTLPVGLATLAPLAEMAAFQAIGVTAILSARSRDLVMSVSRFAECGEQVHVVTDEDGSRSNRLMLLMQRIAKAFAIPGQVAMEQQMACGLGMCFCCVRSFQGADGIEQRRVCSEGPVFALSEALSW
jgi:dihydroorotate dehydrogenase electron transfer subunit